MKTWTNEQLEYLENNWGSKSIPVLSKDLSKSVWAIRNKARRRGLGAFLDNGDYVTLNQLFIALGRSQATQYTSQVWIKKLGLLIHNKKVLKNSFKVVYLDEFWEWAKEYRTRIFFNKMEPLALGEEPSWVADQRRADIAFSKYKLTPWTEHEDHTLINLLNAYRYTYKEISIRLLRTEGAIKRRIQDLGLNMWPLRESPHGVWSDEQVNIVIDLYNKGYRNDVIKEYIDKTAMAIQGKIARLIKEGVLEKRK